MLRSGSHLREAVHFRSLAKSVSDLHARKVLDRMATIYENLAIRAARMELGASASD